ncbi:AlpA family transcriptional regulator [uncultured Azohydromonas sp.]|jgi:Predicted transcriptional regulator|uniref:helix-turn-helix transcriptional regulator n=1 Tax=uncultured Azohydromonas sp. TaxID=487342 RepID=UPI00260B731E|nr:AlpA family phage regulatory protein [uncultured Azohydromonas sp.]
MSAQVNDIGDLADETFVRVDAITSVPGKPGRYPFSPATWWRWVRTKKAPQPVKLGPGITAWRLGDLRAWEAQQAGNGGA